MTCRQRGGTMSVVTVWDERPPLLPHREWTVDDLAGRPDDGLRYELFDGVLVVSPAPFLPHQRAVGALYRLLHSRCTAELEVLVAPFDFQPTRKRSFQPDVLVARRKDLHEDRPLQAPPVLVV